jgi:RalBP1-associated Eps domain-containing protein
VTTIRLDSNPPPAPQPRSNLTNTLLGSTPSGSQRSSAFEVYRKPSKSRNSQSPPPVPAEPSKTQEYEKQVLAISDSLRQVRFRNASEQSAHDILKHLKDQNVLLMRLCKDLSEELTNVQRKKEEIRNRILSDPK